MSQLQQLDLNGAWKIRWTDGMRGNLKHALNEVPDESRYVDAQVPGEVHLDLWKAGVIADPYAGLNHLAARWVEEMLWSYRREFVAPKEALQGRAWLCFDGLDLAATIVLNGQDVGRHNNFFYPCRIDVTGKLREGTNLLVVHLDSGLYSVADKPGEPINPGLDVRLTKRHWLRKPQCQFVWDWSPRLINVGIHRPVRLEWTTAPARVDQFVPLAELSPDLSKGTVRARLFVEGLGTQPVKGTLTVEISEAGVRKEVDVEIKPGLNPYEALLEVANPQLWWPVGHGHQARYTVHATLRAGGEVIGEKVARVGFRHVRVNQEPHPRSGTYFIVEINGRRIFCKGGNFVPADMIFARIDRARYTRLVELALETNFNLLRVWGGGLYEADEFYELCDERGILVWQEFIFACAKYPTTDETFYRNCIAEAEYNVRRLAEHPSLIVWCGNNEIEMGDWSWGYDRGTVLPDYAWFHLTLPRIVAREDPTRYYQPSSPFSPNLRPPNDDDTGDQHPWSIGFTDTDFRKYRQMICRFPNEGGILGPTALPTMQACLPQGQKTTCSFAWQEHDNAIGGWNEPSSADGMVTQWTGRDVRKMSVEDFTYWAGLVQGEGLREYCDNFRRRMFDSASAIFWMYNDCWPATRSWTIVDYFLRRTPAFWNVRRALAPIAVVVAQEADEVVVSGINETSDSVGCELRFGVFNLSGEYQMDRRADVTLEPNAATRIAAFKLSEWQAQDASGAFAMLTRAGELLARHRLFLPFHKDLKWAPSQLNVRSEKGRAIFESKTFVWGVCLDLNGETPLPDNFFDVYPGIAYSLPWTSGEAPRVLRVGNLV